jgi:hypothetical protein
MLSHPPMGISTLFPSCEWALEFLLACQIFVFAIVQVRANKVLRYEQEASSEQPQTSITEPRQNCFHVKCMCMPIYKRLFFSCGRVRK